MLFHMHSCNSSSFNHSPRNQIQLRPSQHYQSLNSVFSHRNHAIYTDLICLEGNLSYTKMSTTLTGNVQSLYYEEEGESSSGTAGISRNLNNCHSYGADKTSYNSGSISEIEEEEYNGTLKTRTAVPMASIEEHHEGSSDSQNYASGEYNTVYVAVGKGESSLEALKWTLDNTVTSPAIIVYLVHVFPEIKLIPSPLGRLPKDQVSAQQVESYMNQERGKRRDLLQSYINTCHASKAKVETILIECDFIAKAILNLIPVLHITELVIGTRKSNLRKLKSRRGNGIAEQIVQYAPAHCDVKVICEGKKVSVLTNESRSPMANVAEDAKFSKEEAHINNPFSCICFKPK